MAISAADIVFRLSGGAANTDPSAALGGAMSTVGGGRFFGQSATAPSTIGGVTIEDAEGNAEGNGSLFFDRSEDTLSWQGPGDASFGTPVVVSAGGKFTIRSGTDTMYILVDVNWGTLDLEVADLTDSITIAYLSNELFDNVDKDESLAGDTEYRCFYISNEHATDAANDVKLWIQADTNGQDTLAIGLDPAGLNGTATTIANENTAPGGVAFSSPASEGAGLSLGDIADGEFYPVWIRRTVPAAAAPVTFDRSILRLSAQF